MQLAWPPHRSLRMNDRDPFPTIFFFPNGHFRLGVTTIPYGVLVIATRGKVSIEIQSSTNPPPPPQGFIGGQHTPKEIFFQCGGSLTLLFETY